MRHGVRRRHASSLDITHNRAPGGHRARLQVTNLAWNSISGQGTEQRAAVTAAAVITHAAFGTGTAVTIGVAAQRGAKRHWQSAPAGQRPTGLGVGRAGQQHTVAAEATAITSLITSLIPC